MEKPQGEAQSVISGTLEEIEASFGVKILLAVELAAERGTLPRTTATMTCASFTHVLSKTT